MPPPFKVPWNVLRQATRVLSAPGEALDLPGLRRTLWHAAVVGLAAGLIGVAFFAALELLQFLFLEELTGYIPLRAHGEKIVEGGEPTPFRPWLLIFLPALGGLAAGALSRYAPEVRGGGSDAMIEAFHRFRGAIRARVIWVKAVASLFTLGTGGSGGREGPTMQIGGAIGSTLARVLKVSARERRILLVAGSAAGIAAVFRTPLGAALLAVEILYRDGFESEALIPSVLASVTAYSVVVLFYGETTLFAHALRYPFVPAHLPLYGLLALFVALIAALFVQVIGWVRRTLSRFGIARWLRPAVGGLLLGILVVPVIVYVGGRVHIPGTGLGLLGGGYGAAQMAITGAPFLQEGWFAVQILLLLCFAKIVATSLTVGSGGSAGDFAPSLAIGALFGGAFGRAAALLLSDARIDPGAFALVGMGAFYGGIAHVPLASLVLVCELAGSYDLLVPLMLAEAVAFVVLRKRTLYPAQLPTPRDSPAHRRDVLADVLAAIHVRNIMTNTRSFVRFDPATKAQEMLRLSRDADPRQDVFPVIDRDGKLVGLVPGEALRHLASDDDLRAWALAGDVMQRPITVTASDTLAIASLALHASEMRELPVIDENGTIIGFLDESDIVKAHLDAIAPPKDSTTELPRFTDETGEVSAITKPRPPPKE